MMGTARVPRPGFALDETQHEVTISTAFHIGVTEVTRGQFAAFVADTGYQTEGEREGWSHVWRGGWRQDTSLKSWRDVGHQTSDDYPAEVVSWNDAFAFCQWLSTKGGRTVRLPTEAEWEYCCRANGDAGNDAAWCFGEDEGVLGDYAWYDRNNADQSHPVARKKPNAWGIHDMHGNVWEWCGDWFDRGYYRRSEKVDPKGPDKGSTRVLRGGLTAPESRSARRNYATPNIRARRIGFRVVMEAPEPGAKPQPQDHGTLATRVPAARHVEQPADEPRALGKVVQVGRRRYTVDLGERDGITAGSVLTIELSRQPVTDPTNPGQVIGHDEIDVMVVRVERDSSQVRPMNARGPRPTPGDVVSVKQLKD